MATITLPRADLPIAGQFQASGDWYRWARDITARVGGVTGTTSAVIEATANEALLRALNSTKAQQKDVRQGDGVTVTPDAAGYTVSADMGYVLTAMRVFMPRTPTKDVRASDGITVSQDAAGYRVAVDPGHIVDLSRTYDRREQAKTVRQGDGITVTLDALGYSVSLDTGFLVNAVRAYTPRPPSPPPVEFDQLINAVRAFLPRPTPQAPPDDVQAVLANRVFSH